jgi:hypothetical protein
MPLKSKTLFVLASLANFEEHIIIDTKNWSTTCFSIAEMDRLYEFDAQSTALRIFTEHRTRAFHLPKKIESCEELWRRICTNMAQVQKGLNADTLKDDFDFKMPVSIANDMWQGFLRDRTRRRTLTAARS